MVGAEVIQTLVKRLPNAPGVYRMMNAAGDVLYVGKARSLKKRVTNYAQGRFHTNRIGRMVRETATMEFVVTRTETEALLLEANLIKRLRPRFNVLLRDDKSFPYILLTGDHAVARHLQASRRALAQGRLFRPVRLGRRGRPHHQFAAARLPAAHLHRLRLREPHAALPALPDQALLRPVHRRDLAPRTMPSWSSEAKDFLSGRSQKVKTEIAAAMQRGRRRSSISSAPRSTATGWRRCRMCRATRASTRRRSRRPTSSPSTRRAASSASRCSSSAPARTGATAPISRRPTRRWRRGEVLGSFLAQFYDDKPVPRADPAVARRSRSRNCWPRRCRPAPAARWRSRCRSAARRRTWSTTPLQNAREALGRRLAETSTQARLLDRLRRDLRPGQAAACASRSTTTRTSWAPMPSARMVVAGPEGFVKNQYRKFNIRSTDITPGDDFGMMREVMDAALLAAAEGARRRRTGRGRDARCGRRGLDGAFPAWPDVILIDGGQGQMTAVRADPRRARHRGPRRRHRRRQGRRTAMPAASASSSRGESRSRCRSRDPVLYFVQRLRDEAHRFAIGSHRARRKKEMVKNPLDEIGGIGPGAQARAAACISARPRRSAARPSRI